MPTQKHTSDAGAIKPHYLYTPEELAPLSGMSAKQLKRRMDEGQIGYVVTAAERGRRITGAQYLAFLESRAVEPVA